MPRGQRGRLLSPWVQRQRDQALVGVFAVASDQFVRGTVQTPVQSGAVSGQLKFGEGQFLSEVIDHGRVVGIHGSMPQLIKFGQGRHVVLGHDRHQGRAATGGTIFGEGALQTVKGSAVSVGAQQVQPCLHQATPVRDPVFLNFQVGAVLTQAFKIKVRELCAALGRGGGSALRGGGGDRHGRGIGRKWPEVEPGRPGRAGVT